MEEEILVVRKEIQDIVNENRRRHDAVFGEYDPFTGLNCYGFKDRIHIVIEDYDLSVFEDVIPYREGATEMWVHKECFDYPMFRQVSELGSIARYLTEVARLDASKENISIVTKKMARIRCIDDPEFAIFITDKIQDKISGNMVPFKLNFPQRTMLLPAFEDMRRSGHAVRVIVLKARQWGGSTLTQLYIKWIQDYRRDGWNAIVVSQIKKASKKIKAMYKKAIQSQAGWTLGHDGKRFEVLPYENSTDDFQIKIRGERDEPIRRSILSVSAFEIIDNERGENYHCAHYSEVAYWKQTPEHDPEAVISSIHGGIHDIQDNVEVYESTGRGRAGFFYETWQEARDPDTPSAYRPVFVPSFAIEYDMRPLSDQGDERVEDEYSFARWLYDNREVSTNLPGFRESGKFFWRMWMLGANFDAINYYRWARNGYKSHAGMATEHPIDEVEAFRTSGNLVFNPYSIAELRDDFCKEAPFRADIVVPKGKKGKAMIKESQVKYREDGTGELKVWSMPNNQLLCVKNRYLVSVDIGGNSANADYTVMTVIDRLGMVPGVNGKPEVVARWRAHCRHDVLAWKAAALAHYYDNALLVIESNTADRERDSNTEGDHFGTIIEEIADYFDNIYTRAPSSESVNEQPLRKYGFQTNKLNKGWLIDNLIAFVEDKLWVEPDSEMYHELSIYERRDDGSMGNIKGKGNHDDVLMSTAIALWVSTNEMDRPDWIRMTYPRGAHNPIYATSEASF